DDRLKPQNFVPIKSASLDLGKELFLHVARSKEERISFKEIQNIDSGERRERLLARPYLPQGLRICTVESFTPGRNGLVPTDRPWVPHIVPFHDLGERGVDFSLGVVPLSRTLRQTRLSHVRDPPTARRC